MIGIPSTCATAGEPRALARSTLCHVRGPPRDFEGAALCSGDQLILVLSFFSPPTRPPFLPFQ